MVAEVEDGKIVSFTGDKDHPVTKGYCCNKGIRFLDVHRDPDRLTYPLKRRNPRSEEAGDFVRISWDDAVGEIAEKLNDIERRHGEGAIAIYSGHPHVFNSTLWTNEPALLASFGNGPRFGAFTIDCGNKFAGSEAIYGAWGVQPIPDLLHTHYYLAVGINPAVSHMAIMDISDPMAKLRAIKRRGGKSVFINPRLVESATPETGEVVQIKPDTDFYFLAALVHEIIFKIGFDRQFVTDHAKNIEGLIDFVKDWTPERASVVTGISAAEIRTIAGEFCSAPSAAIQVSTGVNMGTQGLLAFWMAQMISLLTGNLGKRGGNFAPMGICPMSQFTRRVQDDPYFESEFGPVRLTVGQYPATLMADMLRSERNPIKALIVLTGNPAQAVPGTDAMRAALQGLELIVTIDIYPSATGEMADYLLPAKDFLEREDVKAATSGTQLEPHVQYTPAVVPAAGERRDDWWIISRILQAMGRPSMLDDPAVDPFAGVEAMLHGGGLSIEKLKQLPLQTALLPEPDPTDQFRYNVQNDDGLIDCCPPLFSRAYPAAEKHWQRLSSEPEDQLKLITRRTGLTVNGWMGNLAVHKKGIHMANPLWMNPRDAEARGLFPGNEVLVRSDHGELRADLALDETLRSGVVAMTHGWGHDKSHQLKTARRFPGVNVNKLLPIGPGSFDPMSMQAHMTGINVTVTTTHASAAK
jgi:anaerobic selenocysteine-containing dehydrogenase